MQSYNKAINYAPANTDALRAPVFAGVRGLNIFMLHFKIFVTFILFLLTIGTATAGSFPESYLEALITEARQGTVIDVSALPMGQITQVQFFGQLIYIYRRTADDIKSLDRSAIKSTDSSEKYLLSVRREFGSSSSSVWARLMLIAEPLATKQPTRSIKREFMIMVGASPVTGCVLALIPRDSADRLQGVFRDPCSNTIFDSSGQTVGASGDSVAVPPYSISGSKVRLDLGKDQVLPELPFTREELIGSGTPTQKLIAAAKYNDIDGVREAINDGAEVGFSSFGVSSPLDAAIIGSRIEVVSLLLQKGAKTTMNSEALARFLGRTEVLALLKDAT